MAEPILQLLHSRTKIHLAIAVIGLLLAALKFGAVNTIFYWLGVVFFGLAGVWFAIVYEVNSGKLYSVPHEPPDRQAAQSFLTKLMSQRERFTPCKHRVAITANMDLTIQEILDFITRDFVISWYQKLGADQARFTHLYNDFMWQMLEEFTRRIQKVDFFKFSTQNIVSILTKHFQDIRKARTNSKGDSVKSKFVLHPWLASEEKEMEFLRQAAEVFLIHLLPQEYVQCISVRHMCREILACTLFKPSVDIICDPDYLNQKLLSWLQNKEKLAQEHKRNYTYAATYEDFMKIIEECDDVEHLKQLRYKIISEIMQATTISNLKRAQGVKTDKEYSPKGTSKGDLLKARNLKRYINQLTVAKSYAERRITTLGGPDYKSYSCDSAESQQEHVPGKKVLSFAVIMEDTGARNQLMTYLKRLEQDALLRFWTAVDIMKKNAKSTWHQSAGDAYQMYVAQASSSVRPHLGRSTVKAMESFMIGNNGPEGFWEAQDQIYAVIEHQHYPSFILSDIFDQYIVGSHWSEKQSSSGSSSGNENEQKHSGSSKRPDRQRINAHSTYAQNKLEKLKEKLENKTQALKALKASQKIDIKMKKIHEEIEKEIIGLKTQRRQLEFHIERTEIWAENIGKWKTQVSNAEIIQEDGRVVPYFVLVVHQAGHMAVSVQNPQSSTQGWVIFRRLDDFHALHQTLVQIEPSLKSRQLPTVGKFRLKSIDTAFLNRAKDKIQDYLSVVLEDECLAQSEAVFAFFSTRPELLKHTAPPQKGSKAVFSNIFKSLQTKNQADSDSDDELLFGDEESSGKEENRKDSIAKPLYQLISEVFELHGMFKWMRRTMMAFVQVTYGRSINRQLRHTVEWTYSEPMLIYYLKLFRDSYWPEGKLADRAPLRVSQDQLGTRLQAKQALLHNIPDVLKNLVGESSSKQGVIKMYEAFQDARLNKHLFYNLLQQFMLEIYPELKTFKELGQLSTETNDSQANITEKD